MGEWVKLHCLPRSCRNKPKAQWTPRDVYRYNRSWERYKQTPDYPKLLEAVTTTLQSGGIGSYSGVVLHYDEVRH